MDKILFQGMKFYGYHGVFAEEHQLGQVFQVDLQVLLNLVPAGRSDSLADTVDYGKLYHLTKQVVEGERYQLIERVGQRIADLLLLEEPMIEEVIVKVTKPQAPIPGIYEAVAVEIRRKRG